jgi:hypothetical protein
MKKYILFIIAISFILTSLTSYSSIQQKFASTEERNAEPNISNASTPASNYILSSSAVQQNTDIVEECSSVTPDKETNNKYNENDNIMLKFHSLIEKDCKPNELIKFVDKSIDKIPKEQANKMFSRSIQFLQEKADIYFKAINKKEYEDELFSAYDTYDHILILDNITDKKLKSIVKEIQDCCYKLILCGGVPSFTPIIDFESLKKYNIYLSKETKDFIEIMAVECNIKAEFNPENPMPLSELINRILVHEKYITKYSSGYKSTTIAEIYLKYTKALLFGTPPNTPIKNWDTKKINNDVLDTYKKIVKRNKKTIIGKTLAEYIKLIENNTYIIDENIKNEILNIFKNHIKRLNLSHVN